MAHAQQYRMKCGISQEEQAWWTKFMKDLQDFSDHYNQKKLPNWPLQELIEAKYKAPATPESPRMEMLPEYLSNLVSRESGTHVQVS